MTVVNSEAPTYINQAQPAVALREKAKQGKYRKHAEARGIKFIAAAIDVHGAIGEGFEELLQIAASAGFNTHPFPIEECESAWTGRFRYLLLKRFANCLAFGNHLLMEEATMRSTVVRRALRGRQGDAAKKLYERLWKESEFYRTEFLM